MIEKDQLELLMCSRPYTLAAMTLTASLLYFLLLPKMGGAGLHVWFSMILLVDTFRFSIIFIYKKGKLKKAVDSQKIVRLACLGTILSGFLWGSAGLIFFPDASMPEKMFVFGAMMAVATVSTITIYFMYKITVIFILTVLLPLIVGIYISEAFSDTETLVIICMVSVYLMYLLKSIRDLYINKKEVMSLRKASLEHEKDLLNQREAAESANMAKSQFLANMSHDLRTPMHAILGFSELGNKSSAFTSVERLGDYFLSINQSGQRLLRLLDNILDMSKLEAGQMVLNLGQKDMKAVISKVVEDLTPLFSKRSIEVYIDTTPLDASAIFDEDRIMQVMHNLLSNAIKFAPDNSCIKVKCYHTDIAPKTDSIKKFKIPVPAICVSVSDQGVGIHDTELEEVFNKFVQTGKAEQKNGGTGLGLSISKEIIEIHGGTIKAENNTGSGATFTFIVPQQGPDALDAQLSKAA